MAARYIPSRGDFIVLNFDPQSGHEQKGRRPALVLSHNLFNRHTGLILACPITNTSRNSPFHISLAEEKDVTGFLMVEQMKSIDYRSRRAKKIGQASTQILSEALSILDACLY